MSCISAAHLRNNELFFTQFYNYNCPVLVRYHNLYQKTVSSNEGIFRLVQIFCFVMVWFSDNEVHTPDSICKLYFNFNCSLLNYNQFFIFELQSIFLYLPQHFNLSFLPLNSIMSFLLTHFINYKPNKFRIPIIPISVESLVLF